jgi:hypothetical protein
MYALWTHLLAVVLLAMAPLAVQAAESPSPTTAPQRLVVDSESAPVVSIHDAAQLVEIVLIPNGDYRPVHPDSIAVDADDGSPDSDTVPAK